MASEERHVACEPWHLWPLRGRPQGRPRPGVDALVRQQALRVLQPAQRLLGLRSHRPVKRPRGEPHGLEACLHFADQVTAWGQSLAPLAPSLMCSSVSRTLECRSCDASHKKPQWAPALPAALEGRGGAGEGDARLGLGALEDLLTALHVLVQPGVRPSRGSSTAEIGSSGASKTPGRASVRRGTCACLEPGCWRAPSSLGASDYRALLRAEAKRTRRGPV